MSVMNELSNKRPPDGLLEFVDGVYAPPPPPPPPPPRYKTSALPAPPPRYKLSAPPTPTPPPPPPNMCRLRCRFPLPSSAARMGRTPLVAVNPFWLSKITRVVKGSMWDEIQLHDNQSWVPELDVSEIESLFLTVASPPPPPPKSKTSAPPIPPPSPPQSKTSHPPIPPPQPPQFRTFSPPTPPPPPPPRSKTSVPPVPPPLPPQSRTFAPPPTPPPPPRSMTSIPPPPAPQFRTFTPPTPPPIPPTSLTPPPPQYKTSATPPPPPPPRLPRSKTIVPPTPPQLPSPQYKKSTSLTHRSSQPIMCCFGNSFPLPLRSAGMGRPPLLKVDLRNAYNCEIMLTKIKIPLADMLSAVLALDSAALDIDQAFDLIRFCPTKEEMEMLRNYTGDKEMLGKYEQFFMELMKAPRIEDKLRVFAFKISFASEVEDLKNSLDTVNSATKEVKESAKLRQIMQIILTLGNILNQGTARGSAGGFRLESLLKLTHTHATNNKMNLMHYLCKLVGEKMPELLDCAKDLVHLEAASKIELKTLAEEMQMMSKGLERVEQELMVSENDGEISVGFRKVLKEFLDFAEAEVRSLISLYSEVGRNADSLSQYFGEDPARCPFEQVTKILSCFMKTFIKSREENERRAEAEKKNLEKEKEKTVTKKEVADADT